MSSNDLFDKTKKVVEAQKDFVDLVNDLKNEVKSVYDRNRKLEAENSKLKEEIQYFLKSGTKQTVVSEPVMKEPVIEDANIIEEVKVEEKRDESHTTVLKPKVPQSKINKAPKTQSPLVEFFLGKNIIVKIATILIFLGVISFGQLAYVNWLNEVGRVILIFLVGVFIFGIAYIAEKKKAIVFSNVFYGLSLFVIMYSFILAKDGFGLISNHVLAYLLIGLITSSFIYFKDRRYDFLDIILFGFYYLAALIFVIGIEPSSGIYVLIEVIMFTIILTYITYIYSRFHYESKPLMRVLSFSVNTIILIIITMYINIQLSVHTGFFSLSIFILGLFGLFTGYVIAMYTNEKQSFNANIVTALQTMILIFLGSLLISLSFEYTFGMINGSNVILLFIVSFIPLYTYMYRQQDNDYVELKQYFIIVIAAVGFLYTFISGPLGSRSNFEFDVRNILLIVETLIFYILGKFTKQDLHKAISYILGALVIVTNINHLITDGTFLFDQSNIVFVTMLMGITMLLVNMFMKYRFKDEHDEDGIFAHSITLLALIPVVITFTNDLFSTDLSYLLASILILFIGYRYLCELSIWKLQYRKYFISGIHLIIILLTFAINLVYFDHNFSLFSDVFKFLFMLVMNGYIVVSLREIYRLYYEEEYEENFFMVLFGIGVLVQSFFIHNYINIEFDKVILSSYFLIASAVGILVGFRKNWTLTRKIGLGSIYYSLGKFFIYDFYRQDLDTFVRMITYFILGFILLGISFLYAYLEKTYSKEKEE